MHRLTDIRDRIDRMAKIINFDDLSDAHDYPEKILMQFNIIDEDALLPIEAWSPVPSAITACPTCLLKPTPANPRTSADCPPRPSPTPKPK